MTGKQNPILKKALQKFIRGYDLFNADYLLSIFPHSEIYDIEIYFKKFPRSHAHPGWHGMVVVDEFTPEYAEVGLTAPVYQTSFHYEIVTPNGRRGELVNMMCEYLTELLGLAYEDCPDYAYSWVEPVYLED